MEILMVKALCILQMEKLTSAGPPNAGVATPTPAGQCISSLSSCSAAVAPPGQRQCREDGLCTMAVRGFKQPVTPAAGTA